MIDEAIDGLSNKLALWTDQKIHIHFLTCVLGYQLAALLWHTAKRKAGFIGTPGSLLGDLSNIRLTTLVEATGKRGKPNATHQLEVMDPDEEALVEALEIDDLHHQRPQIEGVGVYA